MMLMVVRMMKLMTDLTKINTVAILLAWRLVMMAMMVVVVTKLNGDGDDEEDAIFEDSEMSPNVWREIKVESHQQASISWRRGRERGVIYQKDDDDDGDDLDDDDDDDR